MTRDTRSLSELSIWEFIDAEKLAEQRALVALITAELLSQRRGEMRRAAKADDPQYFSTVYTEAFDQLERVYTERARRTAKRHLSKKNRAAMQALLDQEQNHP